MKRRIILISLLSFLFVVLPLSFVLAKTVTVPRIEGVIAPVAGEVPASEIIPNEQFTGTITWTPNDEKFKEGVSYRAKVTLIPAKGYDFTSVDRLSFYKVEESISFNLESGTQGSVFYVYFPITKTLAPDILNNIGGKINDQGEIVMSPEAYQKYYESQERLYWLNNINQRFGDYIKDPKNIDKITDENKEKFLALKLKIEELMQNKDMQVDLNYSSCDGAFWFLLYYVDKNFRDNTAYGKVMTAYPSTMMRLTNFFDQNASTSSQSEKYDPNFFKDMLDNNSEEIDKNPMATIANNVIKYFLCHGFRNLELWKGSLEEGKIARSIPVEQADQIIGQMNTFADKINDFMGTIKQMEKEYEVIFNSFNK
ncbi:MAG: hypothetical protein WCJ59_01665 [bacterium]